MKTLDLNSMENIQGGDFMGAFCATFTAGGAIASFAYAAGAAIPTGGGSLVAIGAIGVGCAIYGFTQLQ